MSKDPVHHPIQQAIDDIWNAGHTPRVQVDARREDVVLPESVKTRWGARLVLDLDAAWPLNIAYGSKGIDVDLAFQGHVTRCTLPWESIYVVLDRATGRGMVFEAHLPPDEAIQVPARATPRGAPRAVETKPTDPKTTDPKTTDPTAPREEPVSAPAAASDDEAKKRRARFKVIDGGR